MTSFVIFTINSQFFGINIERVKRILPSPMLTDIPDDPDHVEGMFQFEEGIVKVLSFRKMLGEQSYEEKLAKMFPDLQDQHKVWLEALKDSVDNGVEFCKTTDPHACHLGKWIDSFHPDDALVIQEMKRLNEHHQSLHRSAIDVLEKLSVSVDEAKEWIDEHVEEIYSNTMTHLGNIVNMSDRIACAMQRCLILFDDKEDAIGVNIDGVEDIVHVEDDSMHTSMEPQSIGDYMNIEGVLEHNGKLVTIVKDIRIGE